MTTKDKPDLTVFQEANKKKISWDQRMKLVKEQFPRTATMDWNKEFTKDPDLFARVLRDILKLDQAQPGRPGPRPSLDVHEATKRLRQYMGLDYSMLPFQEAFQILTNNKPYRQVAAKVGLNRNLVYRLLKGEVDPDSYAMREIAKAYDKHPSYFLEYRNMYITNAILNRLEYSPDASINVYRKLTQDI